MKKHFLVLSALTLLVAAAHAQGKVGVNTVNPQATFHVDGLKNNPTSGTPATAQQTDDAVILSNGNLGLGTINPQQKLHVEKGSVLVTGGDINIKAEDNSKDAGDLIFWNGQSTILGRIWSNPAGKGLSLAGSDKNGTDLNMANADIMIDSASRIALPNINSFPSNSTTDKVLVADAGGYLKVKDAASLTAGAATEPWYNAANQNAATANTQDIYQMGNVGAGTKAPQGSLHVDGGKDNPASGTPSYQQASNDFIVTSEGKVGIRTATPSESLTVNGNINVGLGYDASTADMGNRLIFGGAQQASDPILMYRYNIASDQTQLRMVIGDNDYDPAPSIWDHFSIGTSENAMNESNTFKPKFNFWSTGRAGFGTLDAAPKATLHLIKTGADLTPVVIEGCNEYADNAAAVAAGVPVGGIYRTGDILKVVH